MARSLSLGRRLALAFGALFLAVMVSSAALAAWRAGRAAEAQFHERMAKLVGAIPASFVSNADILARTKNLVGADVASYDPQSREFISSQEHADKSWLFYALNDKPPCLCYAPEAYVPGPVYREVSWASPRRWQVFGAWQSAGGGRKLVLLIVPQAEIDRARRAAAAPILWTALAGALAAVALGFLLARSVTRPVKKLAAEAERAAGGELAFRASTGGGREVEQLSAALEHMSAALAAARAEFARSERAAAAGQMAAALAHEIRNPLTSAKMTIEMLAADAKHESAREALGAVLDELSRLELVVEEMLSFARPAPPVFARVDLAEVAREVLGFMRRQLDHAHVRAAAELDPAAPPARADRNKIKQVIVNLLLNAVQAQARGGEVRLRVLPAPEERAAVEVADSGPGMTADELARAFEPFYTTKPGGAGLGLSVSRRIAEEHGGALTGQSAPGRGATFRLELPAWKEV